MAFKFPQIALDKKNIFLLAIIGLILLLLLTYSSSKRVTFLDGLTTEKPYSQSELANQQASVNEKQPSVLETSAQHMAPAPTGMTLANGSTMQPVADPSSLLPKDSNSAWGNLQMNNSNTPDMLEPRQFIGLDTVGQTLKNANLQLRSEPVIEKKSGWGINMSSYEPDRKQVAFEIGSSGF